MSGRPYHRPKSQSLDTLDIDTDLIDDDFKDKSLQRDTPQIGRRPLRVSAQEKKPDELLLHLYTFPFENIVFEGGGNKIIAYCGAVRFLEELNMWNKIQRLCGVSSGALIATLLALGYNSHQLEILLTQELPKIFQEHGCGHCGIQNNNTSSAAFKRLHKWLAQKIKEAAGNADCTFADVQRDFQKELCIVVTNMSQMCPEYLHVKTTPNLPVRLACKMSMASPGIAKPVKYKLHENLEHYFVDGSLVCGYPVHSYDGWWLSLSTADSFKTKAKDSKELDRFPHQERFDTHNEKTVGILLYSDSDNDNFKDLLAERDSEFAAPVVPNTALAKKQKMRADEKNAIDLKAANLAFAVERLLKLIKNHHLDHSKTIAYEDFQRIISQKRHLYDEDLGVIFGTDTNSPDEILGGIKHKKARQVTYAELAHHLQSKGLKLQYRYMNTKAPKIVTMTDFYLALQETVLVINRRGSISNEELNRTIGISTQYVEGLDFDLDKRDRDFLIEQGKRATKAFLHAYITHGSLPSPEENEDDDEDMKELNRDDFNWGEEELSQIIDEQDYCENCDYLNVYHG